MINMSFLFFLQISVTFFVAVQPFRCCRLFKSTRQTINTYYTTLGSTTGLIETSSLKEQVDAVRKWYLVNYQKRAEVIFADQSSTQPEDVVTEALKAILISYRVLELNEESKVYNCLVLFPSLRQQFENTQINSNNTHAFDADLLTNCHLGLRINDCLVRAGVLLQPDYRYKFSILSSHTSNLPMNLPFLLVIETVKEMPELEGIETYEAPDCLPAFEDTLTNAIPSFPFPSVYDFISEVNRPADPGTMAQLQFSFQVSDLKYDAAKLKKKKKNPQDLVNNINCRLTRLAKWRAVLAAPDEDSPDMFDETYDWGQRVRRKYQSLVVQARRDPKYAMDNQYDRRATFIKIIDEWSLRLKRSFKSTYMNGRLPQQDFLAPVLASKWRAEVLALTNLPAQVAFLDLGGPSFIPGKPSPLFNESRRVLWDPQYPAAVALHEMLVWLDEVESVKRHVGLGLSTRFVPFGQVTQHVYSRGAVVERVLLDCWAGLVTWLRECVYESAAGDKKSSRPGRLYSAGALLARLPWPRSEHIKTEADSLSAACEQDHTDAFLATLRRLNVYSRTRSTDRAASVKEVFRDLYTTGREAAEWWVKTVRELDLTASMEDLARDSAAPGSKRWSETMTRVVEESVQAGEAGWANDGVDAKAAAIIAADSAKRWTRYRTVIEDAELLRGLLPWDEPGQDADPSGTLGHALGWLEREPVMADETPLVRFEIENGQNGGSECSSNSGYVSYLFVAPRLFRGVGLNEELAAFVEFARLVESVVSPGPGSLLVGTQSGPFIEVVPLHPRMIDENGLPDHSRRAPHPALLFRVIRHSFA